jgi:hypothetical protein
MSCESAWNSALHANWHEISTFLANWHGKFTLQYLHFLQIDIGFQCFLKIYMEFQYFLQNDMEFQHFLQIERNFQHCLQIDMVFKLIRHSLQYFYLLSNLSKFITLFSLNDTANVLNVLCSLTRAQPLSFWKDVGLGVHFRYGVYSSVHGFFNCNGDPSMLHTFRDVG